MFAVFFRRSCVLEAIVLLTSLLVVVCLLLSVVINWNLDVTLLLYIIGISFLYAVC